MISPISLQAERGPLERLRVAESVSINNFILPSSLWDCSAKNMLWEPRLVESDTPCIQQSTMPLIVVLINI